MRHTHPLFAPIVNDGRSTPVSPFSPVPESISPLARDFLASPETSETAFANKIRTFFLAVMAAFQKSKIAKPIHPSSIPDYALTVPVFFAALEIAIVLNKKCPAITIDFAVGELVYFYANHFFYSLDSLKRFGDKVKAVPESDQDFLHGLLTLHTMSKLTSFPHYIEGLSFYVFASLADKLKIEASVLFETITSFSPKMTKVLELQASALPQGNPHVAARAETLEEYKDASKAREQDYDQRLKSAKRHIENLQTHERRCWVDTLSYVQGSLTTFSRHSELYLSYADKDNLRDPLLTLIGMLAQKNLLTVAALKLIIEHRQEWRKECSDQLECSSISCKETMEKKLLEIPWETLSVPSASKRARDFSSEEERSCRPRVV